MHLESISISNLRSLKKCQSIPIKPLTIAVGANSSGKSSFVRFFPLLRQSLNTTTRGPILWNGNTIDFGSFNEAKTMNSDSNCIEFGFDFKITSDIGRRYFYRPLVLNDFTISTTVSLTSESKSDATYISKIKLEALDHVIELELNATNYVDKVILDGSEMDNSLYEMFIDSSNSFFSLGYHTKVKGKGENLYIKMRQTNRTGPNVEEIVALLKPLFSKQKSEEKIEELALKIGLGSMKLTRQNVYDCVCLASTAIKVRERTFLACQDDEFIQKLQGHIFLNNLPALLNTVDAYVSSLFERSSYMGPLRATAQRFYRQQDLAVDEVDSKGTNLAMFLQGLSAANSIRFSEWCNEHVGLSVEAIRNGAHVSIVITDESTNEKFNIADMGFGFSQILPVLASTWLTFRKSEQNQIDKKNGFNRIARNGFRGSEVTKIVAVEQPELHLHPKLQARIAELFCSIANKPELEMRFILETHSETLINHIGQLVSDKKISSDNIQILLFDKSEKTGFTTIRKTTYDDDGILKDWPHGFFLPNHNPLK